MPANVSTGDREVDEIIDALRYLDPDDRDTWIRIGQALYTMGEKGRGIWSAWSATSQRFPGGDDLERLGDIQRHAHVLAIGLQAGAGRWLGQPPQTRRGQDIRRFVPGGRAWRCCGERSGDAHADANRYPSRPAFGRWPGDAR